MRTYSSGGTCGLEHRVLAELIEEGTLSEVVEKLQKHYRKKRQVLIYSLKLAFKDKVVIYPCHSGSHIRIGFNHAVEAEDALLAARSAGFKLIGLDSYFMAPAHSGQHLLMFSGLDSDIEEKVAIFRANLPF